MNNQLEKTNHFKMAPQYRNEWWKKPFALWVGSISVLCLIIGLSFLTNTVIGGLDHSLHESASDLTQKHSLGKSMEGLPSSVGGNPATHHSHEEPNHHDHVMKTVTHDGGGEGIQYDLNIKTGDSIASKPVILLLKPIRVNNPYAPVPLAVVHEKKIHLLIVSKDLSYFAHEHPVEKEEGYYVLSHTFPTGGEYVLFADYTPIGGHEKVKRHHIIVTPYQPHDVESRAGADVKTQDLIWEANGYRVSLATQNGSRSFTANTPVVLKANVTKNGKAVTDLSPFLGALAHMAIFSKDTKEFLHVHPLEVIGGGPDILLATNFTNPGLYKIWMGFNHQNKIQTSAFVVQAH